MRLADMPEIDLVDVTAEEIENLLLGTYRNITGRALGQADPVRLFILFVAEVILRICNKINYAGRQNLLRTAVGENLDALAANVCTTRIPAAHAKTTLRVTLSAARETATAIPKGTRATAGNLLFATDEGAAIPAGELSVDVPATCLAAGEAGNGFEPGEIGKVVDPIAFVQSIENITKSEGGAEEEGDDSLRERAFEAPERFSTAGPAGAYEWHAKSASALISDVCVWSPEPGKVQVSFLLQGGEIPGQEMLDLVAGKLSGKDVRPLTDLVEVVAPAIVKYDIDATYTIDGDADAATVEAKVGEAVQGYIAWQKARLNRDIDPSELISRIKAVSGARHVIVRSPEYRAVGRDSFTLSSLLPVEVAHAESVKVTQGGRED